MRISYIMPSNNLTLRIFGPILILTGILGFVIPPEMALMSGTAPYNLFHIAFGILGTGIAFAGTERAARWFNIGFGAADLYQAAAHVLGLFPIAYFQWTRIDDVVHVLIGLVLVVIGLRGRAADAEAPKSSAR